MKGTSFVSVMESRFHVQVDEVTDFCKGSDAVLKLRQAERKVMRHAGIDSERHFDIVSSGFLRQLHAVIKEKLIAACLNQHGRESCEIAVNRERCGSERFMPFA